MSLQLLGLMRKANALAPGSDRAHEAISKGKAKLLVLPKDAGERTQRNAENFLKGHSALLITAPYSNMEIAEAIGLGGCSMIAITDAGFAEVFVKSLGEDYAEIAEELARRRERTARRKNKKKGI